MRHLLIISAASEAATGIALLSSPSLVATLLLGLSLETPAALVVGRIAGAGLLALGVACWCARVDAAGSAARGVVTAMFLYNVAAVAVLGYAGLMPGFSGLVLWAVVILHAALAIWCVLCLRTKPWLAAAPV